MGNLWPFFKLFKSTHLKTIAVISFLIVLMASFNNCSQKKFNSQTGLKLGLTSGTNWSPGSTTDSGSDQLPPPPVVVTNPVINTNVDPKKIQYFGYWGLAMAGFPASNIDGPAQYSNLVFIGGDTYPVVIEKINKAKTYNQKIILMISPVFFIWATIQLHNDWVNRWNDLKTQIINPYSNDIIGFYIMDEPYHNASTLIGANPQKNNLMLEFARTFNQITDIVKSDYPNKIIGTTFAYTELKNNYIQQYGIPENIDWVGVNCYAAFGSDCSDQMVINYYNTLASLKKSHQKFMMTMDSYTSSKTCQISEGVNNEILNRINLLMNWIQNRTDVAALTPFLYQEYHSQTEDLCGAVNMPRVKNKYIEIVNSLNLPGIAPAIPTEQPEPQIPIKCKSDQAFQPLCSVNGAQQVVAVTVGCTGSVNSLCNDINVPSIYTKRRVKVDFVCRENGLWEFVPKVDSFCDLSL